MTTTPTEVTTTKTERVVAAMLVENTGQHFLDSGGAYGRSWQRNQGRTVEDWKAQPRAWFNDDFITLSVFHYLTEVLEYSPRWQKKFKKFSSQPGHENTPWLADMDDFAAEIIGHTCTPSGDCYRQHAWNTYNSYNEENSLSQDIQWIEIEVPARTDEDGNTYGYRDTETLIMLQIHGGADARGGYTAPKFFHLNDSDYPLGYGMDEYELWCNWEPPTDTTDPLPDMPTPRPFENHGWSVRTGEFTDRDGNYFRDSDLWDENDPIDPENHGSRWESHVMNLPDSEQEPTGRYKTAWACPTCWRERRAAVPLVVDAAYRGM